MNFSNFRATDRPIFIQGILDPYRAFHNTSLQKVNPVSALMKKRQDELEEIALKRIRAHPGCRGAAAIVLTLDDDGEWSFEISDVGSDDPETVRRAAIAVGHQMHDEFDLATDC